MNYAEGIDNDNNGAIDEKQFQEATNLLNYTLNAISQTENINVDDNIKSALVNRFVAIEKAKELMTENENDLASQAAKELIAEKQEEIKNILKGSEPVYLIRVVGNDVPVVSTKEEVESLLKSEKMLPLFQIEVYNDNNTKASVEEAYSKQTQNAIQESSAGEVFQREQEEAGITGGERTGMEQSQQGEEASQEGQGQEEIKSQEDELKDSGENINPSDKGLEVTEPIKQEGKGQDKGKEKAEVAAKDIEGVELSGLNNGFVGKTYKSFDPRSDKEISDIVTEGVKSFSKTIERKGKKYRVVGLRLNRPNTSTSGRDNYSFASIEDNGNLPSNIDEILTTKAQENIEALYPNEKGITFKPIDQPKSQETKSKTEVVPTLEDVESTAKALEGKDVSALSKELGIEANWDMIGEGDALSGKDPILAYTQKQLPDWNRASQRGEVNPNSKLTYDIVRGKFGGIDNKEVVEAKDENGVVVAVVKLDNKGGIEHIAIAPEFRGKGVANKLIEKLKESNPNLDLSKTKLRSKGFEKTFAKNIIAEAYHKAKKDGSNPELVKAVEELLGKVEAQEPILSESTPSESKEQTPEYIEQTEKNRKIIKTENIKNNFPVLYERVIKNFSNAAWDSADIRNVLSYLISKKPTYKKGMEQLISAQIEAEKLLSELGEDADFITKKQLLEKINSNESYSKDQKDVFSNIVNRLKGDRFFDFTNKNIDSDNGYQFSNNLLKAKDADAFIHEVGHWGFYNLLSSEERTKYLEYVKDRFYGTKNKISDDLAIKRENKILDKILESNSEDNFSEYFAEQFRQYVVDGLAPKELESIFERFKEYLTEIVKLFKDKGYNKDLKPFFDKIIKEQAVTAVETEEKPAKEQKEGNKEQENDLGYHGGNLLQKSDYLTQGYRGDMPFTGHYFFSDRERAESRGNRSQLPNKEVSVVDFSQYNLLKPTTNEYWAAKSGLKRFEDKMLREGIDAAFQSLEDYGGMKYSYPKLYEEIIANKSQIEQAANNWIENELNKIDQKKKIERLETVILKTLGYEGVDVRGLKESNGEASPDSASEGSVIFDIKPSSVKESPTTQDKKKDKTLPDDVNTKEQKFPKNVLDIAKELKLSPQQVQNTYKKYDGSKSIEEITTEDYKNARATGDKLKLDKSKKAFEVLLKADTVSPTAKKKAAEVKKEVGERAIKDAEDIMNNIDSIRQQLLNEGVIKSINCKWGK